MVTVIPVFGKQRPEDHEFKASLGEASLGYAVSSVSKQKSRSWRE